MIAAIVLAGWVVVLSSAQVTVEARVHDVDYSQDPIRGSIDLRVTNHARAPLLVDSIEIVLWADAGRTIRLSSSSTQQVQVQAGEAVVETYPFEVANTTHLGSSVWADIHAVWWVGSDRHELADTGREISVNGALGRI